VGCRPKRSLMVVHRHPLTASRARTLQLSPTLPRGLSRSVLWATLAASLSQRATPDPAEAWRAQEGETSKTALKIWVFFFFSSNVQLTSRRQPASTGSWRRRPSRPTSRS
jgi:hypothetical protein